MTPLPAEPSSHPAIQPSAGGRRRKVARWKGIIPLLLFLVLLVIGYLLFADTIARNTAEESATELLGTQVDIGSLHILEGDAAIELTGLEVADPFDRNRNALSAQAIRVVLEPKALLEKKLVITDLAIAGVGLGTARSRPARPADPDGFAAQTLGQVLQWRKQFDIPGLVMPRIDTLQKLVLNPAQLSTVVQARALLARADSIKDALESGARNLRVRETIDSARALVNRLGNQSPATLGIQGTQKAVADVRAMLNDVEAMKARVEALERGARTGVQLVERGIQAVEAARENDFAFAKSLLQLPNFDAPEMGKAVFGNVSIDKFQRALYWAAVAREYLPPGLDPRKRPGPKRLRADGIDVGFPKEDAFPDFHIQRGQVRFALTGANAIEGQYLAQLSDITTEPPLVGAPARLSARKLSGAPGSPSFSLGAVLDHRKLPTRDSVGAAVGGVKLPGFALPKVPFRLEPGVSDNRLSFRLAGNDVRASWRLTANEVRTFYDSARGGAEPGIIETILGRVLATLPGLVVEAELEGPVQKPAFRVRSNLDQVLSERLKAVAGEELRRLEAMARAKVDSVVNAQLAGFRQRLDSVTREAAGRFAGTLGALEEQEGMLQVQLAKLGAEGLGNVFNIPGLPGQQRPDTVKRDTARARTDTTKPDTAKADTTKRDTTAAKKRPSIRDIFRRDTTRRDTTQ